jgi:hypothetical protein
LKKILWTIFKIFLWIEAWCLLWLLVLWATGGLPWDRPATPEELRDTALHQIVSIYLPQVPRVAGAEIAAYSRRSSPSVSRLPHPLERKAAFILSGS